MVVYKIFNENTGLWMKSGGSWTDKEDFGKVWKKLNHAKSALVLQYPIPSNRCTSYSLTSGWTNGTNELYKLSCEVRKKSIEGIKIICYEIKEVERIDYV